MNGKITTLISIGLLSMVIQTGDAFSQVRIGAETLIPDNPRAHYSRSVNDAPADGDVCSLNPPRFRWRYNPDGNRGGLFTFEFEIAADERFDNPIVSVRTPFNFYNTIAPLPGDGPLWWRVGYIEGDNKRGTPTRYSPGRQFTISRGAEVWDRSMLAEPDFSSRPHPRILLSDRAVAALHRLRTSDPLTRELFDTIRASADVTLTLDWYVDFPANDRDQAPELFYRMAQSLCEVAFMYRVTGETKYASVIPRAVTFASYPKGGRTSPEPMGESNEDSTQNTEFLALLYDWLYPDLTDAQRKLFVESLDWRIDYFIYDFAWKRRGDDGVPVVRDNGSLATTGASHSFEGFWDTFPATIAIYEHSAAAREGFQLGVNWMVGVGSSHGFDEGWNEGAGYSNSKFKWLLNGVQYLDSAFPEYRIGQNPWLDRIGEWFSRVTPIGIGHSPWGHQSNGRSYYEYNRLHNFRRLACLTGNGNFMQNWIESGGPESIAGSTSRSWCECMIGVEHTPPAPRAETDPVGFFPLGGWIMAGTKPPSTRDCYLTSTGLIFQSSLGAYSHSFASENSFEIYAYGQDVTYASGTSDYEPHAFHSMSHNTILIDGIGQSQPNPPPTPRVGFIRAFARGDGYVYWAGDATDAYPKKPLERSGDWWGRLDPIYNERDASHIERFIRHVVFVKGRYYVLFDDLGAARPSTFTWLYHILPAGPFSYDERTLTFDYRVGDVPVRLVHIANRGGMEIIDMKGAEGFKNPLTGEDYTNELGAFPGPRQEDRLMGHSLYLSAVPPKTECRFLAVIAPTPPGKEFPAIERLDDYTVSVDGFVVSFDPDTKHKADIVVDTAAIRGPLPVVGR